MRTVPGYFYRQKAGSHNPRSTVGTVTEIYDYLQLLYARVGTTYHCQRLSAPDGGPNRGFGAGFAGRAG